MRLRVLGEIRLAGQAGLEHLYYLNVRLAVAFRADYHPLLAFC